jgi:hypothetical protein
MLPAMHMSTIVLAAALVGALPQIGRLWTFDDLVAESDLVVIGRVLETRDTGRRAIHPELRPGVPVIELESRIQVLATMKGATGGDAAKPRTITLHHLRIDMDEWRRQHPPAPGQPPPGLMNAGEHLTLTTGSETYLLFLKRAASGWEPTTGHTFPRQSVFALGGATRIGG